MFACSAPDYPQFQPEEDQRYLNRAAVAVLKAPDWCTPQMLQYEAVLPRPPAVAFYDYLYLPGELRNPFISMQKFDRSSGHAGQICL